MGAVFHQDSRSGPQDVVPQCQRPASLAAPLSVSSSAAAGSVQPPWGFRTIDSTNARKQHIRPIMSTKGFYQIPSFVGKKCRNAHILSILRVIAHFLGGINSSYIYIYILYIYIYWSWGPWDPKKCWVSGLTTTTPEPDQAPRPGDEPEITSPFINGYPHISIYGCGSKWKT